MSESLEQQTATSEILRVISSSPTDIQPVFEAIAERAMQLCHASSSGVLRFDGKVVHIVALGNVNPDRAAALRSAFPMAPNTRSASTRAILTCSVVHIPDVLEDPEYGIATQAQAGGFRSVLSVPMLRERKAIGGVTVGRPTSGRFSESQVALLQTFESIEALTRDGILWLGTLHGFRNAEGKMISDKEEGKLTLTEEIFDYTVNTKGAVLTRRVFGDPSPNKIVHGNRITEARETHDLWCYCTSHSLKSLAEVQEWTPTYNACAVIHRPKDFMVLIANALEPLHPLRTVGIYPIVYRKREYEYAQHDGTDPALIKAPFFSSQDEIRFIFESWERPQRAIPPPHPRVGVVLSDLAGRRDSEIGAGCGGRLIALRVLQLGGANLMVGVPPQNAKHMTIENTEDSLYAGEAQRQDGLRVGLFQSLEPLLRCGADPLNWNEMVAIVGSLQDLGPRHGFKVAEFCSDLHNLVCCDGMPPEGRYGLQKRYSPGRMVLIEGGGI